VAIHGKAGSQMDIWARVLSSDLGSGSSANQTRDRLGSSGGRSHRKTIEN
jgi:hypothetical protein